MSCLHCARGARDFAGTAIIVDRESVRLSLGSRAGHFGKRNGNFLPVETRTAAESRAPDAMHPAGVASAFSFIKTKVPAMTATEVASALSGCTAGTAQASSIGKRSHAPTPVIPR